MHGSTLLLCVKQTGVRKQGRCLRGPQKLPAQEGRKPHCPRAFTSVNSSSWYSGKWA